MTVDAPLLCTRMPLVSAPPAAMFPEEVTDMVPPSARASMPSAPEPWVVMLPAFVIDTAPLEVARAQMASELLPDVIRLPLFVTEMSPDVVWVKIASPSLIDVVIAANSRRHFAGSGLGADAVALHRDVPWLVIETSPVVVLRATIPSPFVPLPKMFSYGPQSPGYRATAR